MANFSNYLEQKLIGLTLCGSSFTAPATVWVSLATSLNSDGDSYTEVSTNMGYHRQPSVWVAPTSGPTWHTYLASAVSWTAATTAWGTITHFSVWDAYSVTAGNMLYWGALATARTIATSDTASFPLGSNGLRLELL